MNILRSVFYCSLAAFLLLSACTTQSPDRDDNTQILAVTSSTGKATPYGRSDTLHAYFPLEELANDTSYGRSPNNPIKVGGLRQGPARERMYLNALQGPSGEPIVYQRIGSCCPFPTPHGFQGGGLLDAFKITYEGQAAPETLYLNIYDEGPLLIPQGFTARGRN